MELAEAMSRGLHLARAAQWKFLRQWKVDRGRTFNKERREEKDFLLVCLYNHGVFFFSFFWLNVWNDPMQIFGHLKFCGIGLYRIVIDARY